MMVYIPVYDHGERVQAIETEHLRPMIGSADDQSARICNYKPGVGFYGPIYNNKFFLEEAEVLKYWHGEPSRSWTLATIRELENADDQPYYITAALHYMTAPEKIRKASRAHWTKCHAENVRNARPDMVIFSGSILAAYDAADADPESIRAAADAWRAAFLAKNPGAGIGKVKEEKTA